MYASPDESIELKLIPSKLELFRDILESVSKPIQKTFCILFDEKQSKINLTWSDLIRGISLNESD